MRFQPKSIQRLVREFNKLPGIGSKTSERFVYYLLRQPKSELESLANALIHLKDTIQLCEECYTFSEDDKCDICVNPARDRSIICVVAEPRDVASFEKTGQFHGVYHVLGGVIDHSEGFGPDQLRTDELLMRIDQHNVQEVIIATNPDVEGETTAVFLTRMLKEKHIVVSRIARGLPTGGNIEFADEVTLGNALSGRQKL